QVCPAVARLGVGQGLLVPVWVAGSGPSENRALPGSRPLDDLGPAWLRRALGPGDPARPAAAPRVVVGEQGEPGGSLAGRLRSTVKHIGPKSEQGSRGTCHGALLLGEHL